jgi:DNA (cytosine-5)-methyltransferase 1
MTRPRIADLFCGAGGAGMGLHRAGFEVVGYDIEPQPRYPFEFHQQDALTVDLSGFDAVWASPPCQHYSRLRFLPWLRDKVYWRSIPPTREHLVRSRLPYIIENVEDAGWDMLNPIVLCGKMFGLHLFRHRRFEASWFQLGPPHEKHTEIIAAGRATLGKRHHGLNGWGGPAGHQGGVERHKAQMGIDWMTGKEIAQAVPPAYSEYLGRTLLAAMAVLA